MYTYIYTHICVYICVYIYRERETPRGPLLGRPSPSSPYKIFVYFEAVVHESTILSFPPPTCIAHPGAILLHDYWTVYDSPSDLRLYAIYHTVLVITISCKGQYALVRNLQK